jgi:hypothetical protein
MPSQPRTVPISAISYESSQVLAANEDSYHLVVDSMQLSSSHEKNQRS